MKKSTIWILAVVMAIAFVGLLCIQIFYMRNIVQIRYEQFAQGVRQSLVAVSMRLSRTRHAITCRKKWRRCRLRRSRSSCWARQCPCQEGVKYSFTTSTGPRSRPDNKGQRKRDNPAQACRRWLVGTLPECPGSIQEPYLYQRGLLDDVILNIITKASTRPVSERADSATVARYLRSELDTLGLNVPFEFAVANYAEPYYTRVPVFWPSRATAATCSCRRCSPTTATARQLPKSVFSHQAGLYILINILHGCGVRLHIHSVDNIRLHHYRGLQAEETDRDEERFHQQHDTRIQNAHILHKPGGTDAQRPERAQESHHAPADIHRDKR